VLTSAISSGRDRTQSSTSSSLRDCRALERATNDTRLLVAAPTSDSPTDDVVAAWLQPEGRELWRRIISGCSPTPTSAPGLQFAMTVFLALGAMRTTPHLRHAYDLALSNEALLALGREMALSCEGAARCEPQRRSYEQVSRLLPRLAEGLAGEVHIALAQVGAKFAAWGLPVGKFAAVDGSAYPAWAQQRSANVAGIHSPARERLLRRRTPEAGFLVHSHEYRPDQDESSTITMAMRGYWLTVLVDLVTGLVLTFDLRDATKAHEPAVLRETLLPRLFLLSPDLEVDAIVGDAKYDDDPTHEHLETYYGIHPVVGRKKHALATRARRLTEADHRSVAVIRSDGTAICRAHGHELEYRELWPTNRRLLGLRPGERDPRAFRTRFECPSGCGKVSVATRTCWSNLPYYPYTPHGQYKRFAYRRALLPRRNQGESVFSSTQVGYKQSLDGAARSRVQDLTTQEALTALAFATKGFLSLLAERIARGEAIN
jgi:hypothetical protein